MVTAAHEATPPPGKVQRTPFEQPVGAAVAGWHPAQLPSRVLLEGSACRLEPLDAGRHAEQLFTSYALAPDGRDWTYLATDRPDSFDDYLAWAVAAAGQDDPLQFAVIDRETERAVGTMSLLRADPANGVIEVGWVNFSPLLQRTVAATEAHFLLMRYAFEGLGYRRYEWKCDSLNAPSRRAAPRLGFTFEGVFRQHVVVKGRNRDTAWYSITDAEWPARRAAFEVWLDPANFDQAGRQRRSLAQLSR